MKLGPVTITLSRSDLAAHPTPGPAPTGEIGASGTNFFGGLLTQQDYNPDLQAPAIYDVYDKMRKGDGQVKAALLIMKLPILRSTWTVEPASDGPEDRMIAEFLEADLKDGMTISWQTYLRQAMLHLDFGSMPWELVWEMREGKVHLRKLAPRMPRTITNWLVDEHGGLAGIEQNASAANGYKLVTIPVEKLLLFVNDQEGSDFRGTSVLRAAYKHWYLKDGNERIDSIKNERRGIGIDVGTLKGPNVDEDRKRKLESALMTLHAHEKQYFAEVEDQYTYRVEGLGRGAMTDALETAKYHGAQITRSVLAEFLNMGSANTGSLARHVSESELYLMALEAVADNVADTMSSHLLRRWVDYNWTVQEYPRMKYSRLDTRNTEALAKAVSDLVQVGAITPDLETENELRVALQLPEREEEAEPEGLQAGDLPLAAGHRMTRKPREYERHVDFAAIDKGLDDAEADVVKAVQVVQKRQIAKLLTVAENVFRRGAISDIEDVSVPFKGDIAADVKGVLVDLYRTGRHEAGKEFRSQGMSIDLAGIEDVGDQAGILAFLSVRARALANLMADRLKSSFVWTMLEQLRRDTLDISELRSRLTGLSDREIRKTAAFSVTEALNLGRQSVADEHQKDIRNSIFSSVLDKGTCAPCSAADGREFVYGSADMEEHRPPYKECEGGGRCRCVLVFVLMEEAA